MEWNVCMKVEKNKIIIAVLRVLSNSKKPIGATIISEQIKLYGIDYAQGENYLFRGNEQEFIDHTYRKPYIRVVK